MASIFQTRAIAGTAEYDDGVWFPWPAADLAAEDAEVRLRPADNRDYLRAINAERDEWIRRNPGGKPSDNWSRAVTARLFSEHVWKGFRNVPIEPDGEIVKSDGNGGVVVNATYLVEKGKGAVEVTELVKFKVVDGLAVDEGPESRQAFLRVFGDGLFNDLYQQAASKRAFAAHDEDEARGN